MIFFPGFLVFLFMYLENYLLDILMTWGSTTTIKIIILITQRYSLKRNKDGKGGIFSGFLVFLFVSSTYYLFDIKIFKWVQQPQQNF